MRLHYLEGGQAGPPVVLLHATSFCAHLWLPLSNALGQHYRIVAMDMPGHGDSEPAPSYIRETIAAYFTEFVSALALEQPIGIGHSAGAFVLATAAAQRSKNFGPLILIEPTFAFPTLPPLPPAAPRPAFNPRDAVRRRRSIWSSREEMLAAYRHRFPFAHWREEMLRLYVQHGTRLQPDGSVELKCSPETEHRMYQGSGPQEAQPILRALPQPVLILWGQRSHLFSQAHAERIVASLPRGHQVGFAEAGHYLPMEQPEATEAVVRGFLAESALD